MCFHTVGSSVTLHYEKIEKLSAGWENAISTLKCHVSVFSVGNFQSYFGGQLLIIFLLHLKSVISRDGHD